MGKFRLLSKREIDARKAADKRMEIEEGAKLAGRVDHLRETAATEESKLERYRIQALTEIQAAIDPKLEESRKLDSELREKRAERERLMKPLDEEWATVKAEQRALAERQKKLAEGEGNLKLAISVNIQRERENKIEQGRAKDAHSDATEELVAAQKLHTDAKAKLKDANEKSAIINEALALREKEVTSRERIASQQYQNLLERQKRVDAYENTIFVREQKVKESWKLLIETQKQYGQPTRGNTNDNSRQRAKR